VTIPELVRVLRRQFLVVLAGILLTMGTGYHLLTTRGEYVSSVGIYFFRPPSINNANRYLADDDVTSVAEIVGIAVNSSASKADLRAAGVHNPYTLEMFNVGNQFVVIHDRALLDLSVRGPTEESVRRTMDLVIGRVQAELRRTQLEAGATSRNLVTTQLNPGDPVVYYGRGSAPRAMVAITLLGGVLTVTAAVGVDRLRRRRSVRAARAGHRPEPVPV
jgi:hypothetical protein